MQLPIFVRSPWYRLGGTLLLMIVLAAAVVHLLDRPIGGVFGGIIGGLIVPVLREWPLMRLRRADRRIAIEAIRTGHSTGRPDLDGVVVDRLSRLAMYRPRPRADRITQLVLILVICGVVLATSVVRSTWWLLAFVPVALVLAPLVVLQRQSEPADDRLARLLSEMDEVAVE